MEPAGHPAGDGLAQSSGHLMDLLSDVETIAGANSVEDVWQLLSKRLGDYGFDRVIYAFTRFKGRKSYGDPLDALILTNHTPRYAEKFFGEAMYFNAPMVRWTAEHVGACSWRWVHENIQQMTPGELKVIEFNRSMGVLAGYSISFPHTSYRSRGAMALTAPEATTQDEVDAIWAQHGRLIHALCNVAHLKLMSLPYGNAKRSLTKRQREVLEWVGDGKTTQDIAMIMGLTPATVEKHLRLAREALEVDTTAQAVLKASMQNQIFLLES